MVFPNLDLSDNDWSTPNDKRVLAEQQPTPQIEIQDWGAVSSWTNQHWDALRVMLTDKVSGEEIMKKIKLKRRKDLEHLLYKLSTQDGKLYTVSWAVNYDDGGRELPDLKADKVGNLRVSSARFKAHGFSISPYDIFKLKKYSDTEICLQVIR